MAIAKFAPIGRSLMRRAFPWPSFRRRESAVKRVALALQGGGAHGAVTWGVLDRLLAEPQLEIAAISGASAGSVNLLALAQGFAVAGTGAEGRDEARRALRRVWEATGRAAPRSMASLAPLSGFALDLLGRLAPSTPINPFDLNPLRPILSEAFDFDRIRAAEGPGLFVSATDVRTGRPRIFTRRELTLEAALASSCLPLLVQAEEIDSQAYWDGGFSDNPPLWPLLEAGHADLLLVRLDPDSRPDAPRTLRGVVDRATELAFNHGLRAELRSIARLEGLIDSGRVTRRDWPSPRLHVVPGDLITAPLPTTSKLAADLDSLENLRAQGEALADRWLGENLHRIGAGVGDWSVWR